MSDEVMTLSNDEHEWYYCATCKGNAQQGIYFDTLGKNEESAKIYDEMWAFSKWWTEDVVEQFAMAFLIKALNLVLLERVTKTIKVYDEIIERFKDNKSRLLLNL